MKEIYLSLQSHLFVLYDEVYSYLSTSLQRDCPHYNLQSIDRCTSVSLIRHTYSVAYHIKYKPSSNGKRHLICCTHIPLVARLLAGSMQEDVDRDKFPFAPFLGPKINDTIVL